MGDFAGECISGKRRIVRYGADGARDEMDDIAVEYALTIRLDGEDFATMVCTPADLEELVVGFLASEGVIRLPGDIKSLAVDEASGFVRVELANPNAAGKSTVSKRFIGSCCGKSRQFYFHNDARTAKTSTSAVTLTPLQCRSLMAQLQASSGVFHATGGLHNAALCTPETVVVARADIGRHNALDKIYGYCLQRRVPTKDAIVAFSGRISSEVLLKVAKIGAGVVLSKSAPTTLALDLADDLGITAVGFIRGETMNVYTHSHRIVEV